MIEVCIMIALLSLSGALIAIGRYFTWKTKGKHWYFHKSLGCSV